MSLWRLGEHAPEVHPAAWIAPTATVCGRVILAEDASIWFGAVLRAENEPIVVGARSNIQDLCVVHTDPGFPLTIGTDCTIGHKAVLHGCTIGTGSIVGIGAIVLNGARVGQGCLIAAGALVPEGAEIPDRSLVMGTPGKVKRELAEAEVARMIENAARYVSRAREYQRAQVDMHA